MPPRDTLHERDGCYGYAAADINIIASYEYRDAPLPRESHILLTPLRCCHTRAPLRLRHTYATEMPLTPR